jgi:type I restriction-modification system DNA methylase subunit
MSPQIEAQNLSELQGRLWNIADTLRGKMNADEFRDYCLGFIFYKYLKNLSLMRTKFWRKMAFSITS